MYMIILGYSKVPKDIEIAGRLKGYCTEEKGVIWIVAKNWKNI